ncbi:MAG: hypothetical protein COZ49_04395 [Candidatus Yonathbacteria bacterium CG_4_10_14_3_um_filter_47_65]|uniref:SIMPL domain-containing protein n=2 Tax=Parcubacteria group TaxID=1794811 RepID=A0A2M8D6F7_9BACT|nr:MAG: hypothetical protein AUJ44_04240 [Candidatus Nomurabacteria bacterium CG1_02_47_685]PIP03442.1 MAG: hypothetical protein COX54_03600 [Candidatus Yonathbacteria bacterium CG23_combo_of_CG06-09_8_20_14_all_46_18]PIQ31856.1 MAG: hypothetical protein COW61_03145 [Candidatus Yonathbacteria bacterium CG17_big_fil_post_rev_8_21_14_2_50_46_19]PIX56009.1 MAG: hypothetical protein COZ49_04395 [Candidatus Yonathbacteria bacterium CG_4_10_14_3_um_filter_47_65]PIY57395.1 MAG: hypothetical protein CO
MNQDWTQEKKIAARMFAVVAGAATFLFIILGVTNIYSVDYIGKNAPPQATISVSGQGKAFATPDIAEVSFSITAESVAVPTAQEQVSKKLATVRTSLTELKILPKDIRNEGYNIYPRYEYERKITAPVICDASSLGGACPPVPVNTVRVLKGYEVTQSVVVKVRDLAIAGKVVDALGAGGVTNVGGINLMVENPDNARNEAREEAITKAKQQARVLTEQLGVKLVRIISFNEGGYYPVPMMYSKAEFDSAGVMGIPTDIPVGENVITANVSIVYEIR